MNTMRRDGHRLATRVVLSIGAALALPCPAWATLAFQESNGQVVMQAENYDNKIARNGQDWLLKTSQTGYSGSGYMEALPNSGTSRNTGYVTGSPELVYNVQFTTTGTYYVWVRGYGASGNDDSLHAGIDGVGPSSADRMSGYGTSWSWRRSTSDSAPATVVVSDPGLHTIHLWMREDGFKADKILLRTSSSSTAPSGTGPAESPRVTLGPPPDTTPPTGSIIINGGAPATNTLTVTLTLSATDDSGTVAQMQCSNDGVTFSAPEPYAMSKTWSLSAGDGTKTVLVRVADAANVIGTWTTAANRVRIARQAGIPFHVDGVGAVGRIPLSMDELGIDLLTLSSNDLYGPPGVGALWVRPGVRVVPQILGGGQEDGYRSGTENLPGIVGMGVAAELVRREWQEESLRLVPLRDKLIDELLRLLPEAVLTGPRVGRLPSHASLSVRSVKAESILMDLALSGIAASTGSACASKTQEPSHVLRAIGCDTEEAEGSLCFTLGRWTTGAEIEAVLEHLPGIVQRLRALSPKAPASRR